MNEHVVLRVPLSDYDTDFYAWSLTQAQLLRGGHFDRIDIENLAEEIESLAKRDRSAIKSQMVRLIAHLLKLEHSTQRDPAGVWRSTVRDARREIDFIVSDSPSLRGEQPSLFLLAWPYGLEEAAQAMREFADAQGASSLGSGTPLSVEQALDPAYFPGA